MPTSLLPILEKSVNDLWVKLEREQITPWVFMTAGPPFQVTDFYGKPISYQGITFEGSPRRVFWGRYIEPFLEDATEKVIQETLALAKEKRQDSREALKDVSVLLRMLAQRAYNRMADIDRRLRGNGNPLSVSLRSTETEELNMAAYIDRRINAELSMQKPSLRINDFYNEHPFLFWLIALVVASVVTLVAA